MYSWIFINGAENSKAKIEIYLFFHLFWFLYRQL